MPRFSNEMTRSCRWNDNEEKDYYYVNGKPAGRLSFWLGPIFFRQIPLRSPRKYDAFTCCTDVA